jgi:hypothetical protein
VKRKAAETWSCLLPAVNTGCHPLAPNRMKVSTCCSSGVGVRQVPTYASSGALRCKAESLLPLLACSFFLPLTLLDVIVTTVIFFVGELALSLVLFKLHIRNRPY